MKRWFKIGVLIEQGIIKFFRIIVQRSNLAKRQFNFYGKLIDSFIHCK